MAIDENNFPDADFREYVGRFDTDGNGSLSESEISGCTSIDVGERWSVSVRSLEGIEYFTALEELRCSSTSVSSLDVSQNPALVTLDCSSTNVSSLDVSQNPALVTLDCSSTSVSSLDVSQNPALVTLDCSITNVSSLDVSQNPALVTLDCSSTNVSSLDVSQNPALVTLDCFSTNVSSLDVSQNPALATLDCRSTNMSSLDVSRNPALEELYCGCYNGSAYISGDISNISSLDVSQNPALRKLYCSRTKISSLDVSQNPALEWLSCHRTNISSLDVSRNPALKWLDCAVTNISSLDVSQNSALEDLDCGRTNISSLDVSQNPALRSLRCVVTSISSLDLSQNPALRSLRCGFTSISSLDVSQNPALGDLDCNGTSISSLDLSRNPNLWSLNCSSTSISSLDLSRNLDLENLWCSSTNVSSLDVSQHQSLLNFDWRGNVVWLEASQALDLSAYDPQFDKSRVSNSIGIEWDGNILTLQEEAQEGSYDYFCGRGKTMTVAVRRKDIEEAEISGLAAPLAGAAPNYEGVSVSFGQEQEQSDIPAGNITWSPAAEEAFAYDTAYTVSILVPFPEKRILTQDTRITLNGNEVTEKEADAENRVLTIRYTFPATEKEKVPEKPFTITDVPQTPGNWKYDSVRYVNDRGIMGGVGGSNQFQPDNTLTRAMFATVLYRMAGEPETAYSSKFSDVKAGQWYSSAILWASGQKIVSGYGDGSYGINDNITREQIAKMLYLYGKSRGYDVSGTSSLDGFTDKGDVSNWAEGFLQWAAHAKMISGKPNGDGSYRLDPKGKATRAECAKMLMMFLEKYN